MAAEYSEKSWWEWEVGIQEILAFLALAWLHFWTASQVIPVKPPHLQQ